MREEHRHGRRDEGWGPPRPGGPEWGPRPGRGAGRYGGERMERGDFRGGPGWGPGGPGRHGFGGRRWAMGAEDFGPGGPGGPVDPKACAEIARYFRTEIERIVDGGTRFA